MHVQPARLPEAKAATRRVKGATLPGRAGLIRPGSIASTRAGSSAWGIACRRPAQYPPVWLGGLFLAMSILQRWPRLWLPLLGASLASCSATEPVAPPPPPPPNPILGTYQATVLTVVMPGQTLDVLASGGSLTITLASNGTTSGRLFVPGGGENGEDFDASMAGTWNQTGDTVRFVQDADTYVRDATWTVVAPTLRTTFVSGTTTITTVLTKQ